MQIYRSASTDFLMTNFIWKKQHYHSVSVRVFFRLSSGTIEKADDAVKQIAEAYPDLVQDESLPKLYAEWLVTGRVYRNKGKDYGFVHIGLAEACKEAYINFSNTNQSSADLGDPELINRAFMYERALSLTTKQLRSDFTDLPQTHPDRMKYWGDVAKSDLYSLPDNFDFRYNSCAREDQRVNHVWKAGDSYCLQGVVPEKYGEGFSGKLPAADIRCYAVSANQEELSKGELKLDTVRFFPDLDLAVMSWHGLFSFEPDNDFCLIMVVADQDYSSDDSSPQIPDDSFYSRIAWEILEEKKRDKEKTAQTIKKKVQSVKKESREVMLKRYSEIYMEHHHFDKIFDKLPNPTPLYKDRLDAKAMNKLKKGINYTKQTVSQLGFTPDAIPYACESSFLERIMRGEILDEEKNFKCQISALMHYAIQNLYKHDCTGLLGTDKRKIHTFAIKHFLLGYIPKPLICNRSDWGLEGGGTFEIPAGIAVPEFYDREITSVTVYPKGIADPEGAFTVPGSTPGNIPSWHAKSKEKFAPKIVAGNLIDGLFLTEELWHVMDVVVIPDPEGFIDPRQIKECKKIDFLFVPAADDKIREERGKWIKTGICPDIVMIPFGQDREGRIFETLRDRLLYNDETIAMWLNKYIPFRIPEPLHITQAEYVKAYDEVLVKKAGLKPGKLNFTERALEINEEKRNEVLSYCRTQEMKDTANKSFDRSAAEIKATAGASDEELITKAINLQKQNVKERLKSIPEEYKIEGNLTDAFDDQQAILKQKIDDGTKKHKEFLKHLEELTKLGKKTNDEIISEANLSERDLEFLDRLEIRCFSSLYISKRTWRNQDLTGRKFSDSKFDEVNFEECTLNGDEYTGCVFTSCKFTANHMIAVKFTDCEFTECTFENFVAENNEISNASFMNCIFRQATCRSPKLNNITLSVCRIESSCFNDGVLSDISGDFVDCRNAEFKKTNITNSFFADSNFENCDLSGSFGERFIFDNSSLHGIKMDQTTYRRIEFYKSTIEDCSFREVHFNAFTMDESQCSKNNFDLSVLDDVYARSSDLSDSSFQKTVSIRAVFTLCIIRRSDFFHANLLRADFSGSKLGKTSFKEANLFEADFRDTALGENNFDNAIMNRTIISFMAEPKL